MEKGSSSIAEGEVGWDLRLETRVRFVCSVTNQESPRSSKAPLGENVVVKYNNDM